LNANVGTISAALNTTIANSWASGGTLTAFVRPAVTIAAGLAAIDFAQLSPGQSSEPVAAPVRVTSNDGFGYQLSASRTAFSAGDIPLTLQTQAPSDSGMILDVERVTLAPGVPVNVGHRSGALTPTTGDHWATKLTLGPIPKLAPAGFHRAVLTYTATGL
jgi:hypothetical protein